MCYKQKLAEVNRNFSLRSNMKSRKLRQAKGGKQMQEWIAKVWPSNFYRKGFISSCCFFVCCVGNITSCKKMVKLRKGHSQSNFVSWKIESSTCHFHITNCHFSSNAFQKSNVKKNVPKDDFFFLTYY